MSDYSNLIEKYSEKLSKDPLSKVFAPLGEIYRKLGMYERALSVYDMGLKHNPDYTLGQVGLSQCYYDLEQYQRAYNVLKPHFKYNADNIKYLKLFAKVCDRLNLLDETVNIQKAILFLAPKDAEAANYLMEYEDKATSIVEMSDTKSFDVEKLDDGLNGWTQLSLVEKETQEEVILEKKLVVTEDTSAPVFSHTLVDLYLKQGAKEKAIALLEKAIEVNPKDSKVIERLSTLRSETEEARSTGHDDLMKAFDSRSEQINKSDEDQLEKVTMAFNLFMKQIELRRDTVLGL
ncbi:MAG: hypothetical protein BM556_09655 [Bacteriovorax sp. MedPE-SWde]|nr:MAG: hypothetical protein BM556_09655 [Bacteriovorax sp. MedPE-SWde]